MTAAVAERRALFVPPTPGTTTLRPTTPKQLATPKVAQSTNTAARVSPITITLRCMLPLSALAWIFLAFEVAMYLPQTTGAANTLMSLGLIGALIEATVLSFFSLMPRRLSNL